MRNQHKQTALLFADLCNSHLWLSIQKHLDTFQNLTENRDCDGTHFLHRVQKNSDLYLV